ncbi:MAG: transporter substrate-binding domain-containing protein [Clostridia bacterium]|nr:transporter substrate-binding domain-containing protein [Clostridia bacterium]
MKKILALVFALAMICMSMAACSTGSDAEYIEGKGSMIIGITYFEPMNYLENGELTGFETEFATAVCEILGVTPQFQEIVWDTKEIELKSKTIDCIWNGMTITADRQKAMSISDPYMNNKQVLVVKAENVGKWTDAASFKDVKIVAEAESAGESTIKTDALFAQAKYTAVDSMKTAIFEVFSGTADACVVDFVTSIGMIGEGTDYANLAVDPAFSFAPEQYGIAFRKGSDFTAKVNAAIDQLIANGTLKTLAEKYKLGDQLVTD